jgi:hypothetical protein
LVNTCSFVAITIPFFYKAITISKDPFGTQELKTSEQENTLIEYCGFLHEPKPEENFKILFGCHVGKAVKLETREDQNMR